MKVSVVPSWRSGSWQVRLAQGGQSFDVSSDSTKTHAEWMAKMLRIAIRNHDKEKSNGKIRGRN